MDKEQFYINSYPTPSISPLLKKFCLWKKFWLKEHNLWEADLHSFLPTTLREPAMEGPKSRRF
jgi:hypothetical protein